MLVLVLFLCLLFILRLLVFYCVVFVILNFGCVFRLWFVGIVCCGCCCYWLWGCSRNVTSGFGLLFID